MQIALLIALLLGGGTSIAAQNALPGDMLYPVKVNVNEEFRSMLTFGNEAEAKFHAEKAAERIEEAEKLAAEGRLTAEAQADINANFKEHVSEVRERISEFESEGKYDTAASVNAEFESALRARETALVTVEGEHADMRSTVDPVLVQLRAQISETTSARVRSENKISGSASSANTTGSNSTNASSTGGVKVNGNVDVNLNTGTETQTGTSSTGVKTNGGIKVDLGL